MKIIILISKHLAKTKKKKKKKRILFANEIKLTKHTQQ